MSTQNENPRGQNDNPTSKGNPNTDHTLLQVKVSSIDDGFESDTEPSGTASEANSDHVHEAGNRNKYNEDTDTLPRRSSAVD